MDDKFQNFYYYSNPSTRIQQLTDENIILYPNPTSGRLNITGLNDPADANIYSINGQLIKSIQQINNSIDISELTTGIYILKMKSDDKTLVRKVVKE